MSKFLKIDDLIKELQEIKEKHGNLDILFPYEKQWDFLKDFLVMVEKNIYACKDGEHIISVEKAVTIGVL